VSWKKGVRRTGEEEIDVIANDLMIEERGRMIGELLWASWEVDAPELVFIGEFVC
jgi:hypothetical protein